MRIVSCAAILFLSLLFLVACGGTDQAHYLSHQTYPLKAEGILTYDGEDYTVAVEVPRSGDIVLTVVGSHPLCGSRWELTEGRATVSFGGISQEWEDGGYAAEHGILLTARLFALSGQDYIGTDVVTDGEARYSCATYAAPGGTVTVYRQADIPMLDRITGELNGHSLSFRFVNES